MQVLQKRRRTYWIQLASISENGEISYCTLKKIENGTATFNVPYPTSFAVIETSSDGTGSSLTPSDSSPIRTGAVVCTTSFVILVLSGAVLFILKRRNKFD